MSNQITPNPSVPSQVVQEVKFPKFVNNLGIIPTSYKDSMSYYECLAWLCKYLEETVIPTVNENGEATQELQNLYVELNSYVTHYFDNLDVQEEINNKLDKMIENGTINAIIGSYITSLDDEMISLSQKVTNMENYGVTVNDTNIISLNMLTPEVRESITGGSTAVIGIDSVGAENIKSKSIDILHMNDSVSKCFTSSYTDVNLENISSLQGFAKGQVGSNLTLTTDTGYHYKIVNLVKDRIYHYIGSVYMLMNGITVVDSNNTIIYATRNTSASSDTFIGLTFRVYENGMKAYVSYRDAEGISFQDLRRLSYISDVNPTTFDVNPILIKTLADSYLRGSTSNTNGYATLTSNSNSTCKIYQMNKGTKYIIHAYDQYLLAGLGIFDINFNTQYLSSTENKSNPVEVNRTFTAENDGYIILSELNSSYPSSISIVNRYDVQKESKLKSKSISYTGDSICYGAGYTNGYAGLIATNTNSYFQNIAVGGGTIADGTTYEDETPRFHICNSITNLSASADMIVIEGGCNDYWNNVPIGSLTSNYSDNVDNTTFIGALEFMFRTCMTRYDDKPIFFVINHNINNINFTNNSIGKNYNDYREAIYLACEKYGVKIIDIGKDTSFNTYFTDKKNNLTDSNDGVHPNQTGYEAYYVPIIQSTLEMFLS